MSYTVIAEYRGLPDHDRDFEIEKVARKTSDGSGYGFGKRDMGFTFASKRGAENAIQRIKKLAGVRAYYIEG
jgi:hypothetical protein